MKTIFIFLVLFFSFSLSLTAQTVEREFVVLEIGTGTWCYYCPGAAMGADDLVENGKDVAVIEYHNGDAFVNPDATARLNYYSISSFPTAKFDGVLSVVGGSHSQSMYPQYLPKYNQRKAISSPLTLTMSETHNGLDYTVVVTATQKAALPSNTLALQFAITVSNISVSWQGQSHLDFVAVDMVPSATGTILDFSNDSTIATTLNFSLDPTWPVEDVEFVAFIQNNSGKEILQGAKMSALPLTPDFTASTTDTCPGSAIQFNGSATGGFLLVPEEYEWNFPGGNPQVSIEQNPVVTYSNPGSYDVELTVRKTAKNVETTVKQNYITISPNINIASSPADTVCDYETVTLDATLPNAASYLWMPGQYTTPTITFDSTGLGLGSHEFTVEITTLNGCIGSKSITITFENCAGIDSPDAAVSLTIYPNPGTGLFTLYYQTGKKEILDIRVTNSMGATVFQQTGIASSGKLIREMDLTALGNGIYYLTITRKETQQVQKIIITR